MQCSRYKCFEMCHLKLLLNIMIVTLNLVLPNNAARILGVFPTPSISHQVVFRSLTQELAKRGHELVILTTDPAFENGKAPKNITEIDLHEQSYALWNKEVLSRVVGNSEDAMSITNNALKILAPIVEIQINTKEVQDLIKSKPHFDLLLIESYARPALVMSHVFKAPVIQVSSFMSLPPNYQVIGSPAHQIFFPEFTRQRIYNLTVWEKIRGVYDDLRLHSYLWCNEDAENAMLRRNFGPDVPSLRELSDNVDMLFLNVHPIWEGNRAVPPGVIHMGGLPKKPVKELPGDLKTYLDRSQHGVIYMSFGTNIIPSQLPPERIQIFCEVFSKLSYDIIWKWDKDELPGKPKNVRLTKWVPQSDLLRHPKIKLFITQGGLQSTDEAISAGVPLIAFPIIGDQWYNAEKYVYHKIGLNLNFMFFTEKTFLESINTMITNDSYRQNIKRLGALMNDQPQSPLDRAIWWIEYVIRHGGAKHLRSPAANVSWTEFLMLDVIFTIFSVFLSLIYLTISLIKILFAFSYKKYKEKTSCMSIFLT